MRNLFVNDLTPEIFDIWRVMSKNRLLLYSIIGDMTHFRRIERFRLLFCKTCIFDSVSLNHNVTVAVRHFINKHWGATALSDLGPMFFENADLFANTSVPRAQWRIGPWSTTENYGTVLTEMRTQKKILVQPSQWLCYQSCGMGRYTHFWLWEMQWSFFFY